MTDIRFRQATAADTEDAVPLVYSSGPTTFDFAFAHPSRGTALEFLRFAFADGAGEFGCRNHTVVLVDGRIVAIGTGFGRREVLRSTPAVARQVMLFYGMRRAVDIGRRGRSLEHVLEPPKGPLHYIGHLGVAPDWQSKGIGRLLVEYLVARGRAQGRSAAVLDVSVANPRAQVLYERLGFVVAQEKVSNLRNEFGAVPSHRRMERVIEPGVPTP